METTNIQCGACGQLIAVSNQHLGQQVQCPLCGAVIEAPAAEPHFVPRLPPMSNDEDSIFAPPEEEEDIFGRREEGPRVEMPSGTALLPDAPPRPKIRHEEVTENMTTAPHIERHGLAAGFEQPRSSSDLASPGEGTVQRELATFTKRRPDNRGTFGALVMIFLVPYAIVITFALVYMIYQRSQLGLGNLPDPDAGDGAPIRMRHDWPLPAKQRTELGKEIQVGDLRVTPLKVERTPENDLILQMKMENTSTDTRFNPFPDSYHRYAERKNKPYTFIECANQPPIYGGYTERFRRPPGHRDEKDDGSFNGIIAPGETVYATLTTYDKGEVRSLISRALNSNAPLLWRVHVRRGFVTFRGRSVSSSAVFGVEIPASAIAKL